MGLHKSSTQDELVSCEGDSEAPAEDSRGIIAGLRDDSNRLAAARGVALGTVLGGIICATVLWVLR